MERILFSLYTLIGKHKKYVYSINHIKIYCIFFIYLKKKIVFLFLRLTRCMWKMHAITMKQRSCINTWELYCINHKTSEKALFFICFFISLSWLPIILSHQFSLQLSSACYFHFLWGWSLLSCPLMTMQHASCPSALSTIKSAVESAVSSEARMRASLLRHNFHDCFVNASHL